MSAAATNPVIGQLPSLFGRKYQVQVTLPNEQVALTVADSDFEPQALRVTFETYTRAIHAAWWEATICVYNADAEIVNALLTEQAQGMTVSISAGYQNGNYALIWSGPVFQAYLERENVTDTKLTLYCIRFLPPLVDTAGIGDTYKSDALLTQTEIVKKIAKLTNTQIAQNGLSDKIKTTTLPRAKTVFGNLGQHLTNIAEDNNMQWWLGPDGLNMANIQDGLDGVSAAAPLVYSPPINGANSTTPLPALPSGTGSIIGTPQETMQAVALRVLLDPRVRIQRPLMTIKIDNSQLQFLKRQIGQFTTPLDETGTYVVAAVQHRGDTRGNTWYTEIMGAKRIGNLLAMVTPAGANTNNGSPGAR